MFFFKYKDVIYVSSWCSGHNTLFTSVLPISQTQATTLLTHSLWATCQQASWKQVFSPGEVSLHPGKWVLLATKNLFFTSPFLQYENPKAWVQTSAVNPTPTSSNSCLWDSDEKKLKTIKINDCWIEKKKILPSHGCPYSVFWVSLTCRHLFVCCLFFSTTGENTLTKSGVHDSR